VNCGLTVNLIAINLFDFLGAIKSPLSFDTVIRICLFSLSYHILVVVNSFYFYRANVYVNVTISLP